MTLSLESVSCLMNGETVIGDVSVTLQRRVMNVLLGPTLSGKTTLMRLMAGLEAPSRGHVRIDGNDVTGIPVRKRSVAMVYQQFVNYPGLSVYDNIASPLRVAGIDKAEIDQRVGHAAELLKLERFLSRKPLELSGGQQQRVAIARALVKRADLVLLDEPLANLDYKLREELREELPRLFASTGAILVYATTEPVEALLLGGTTVTLWEGRVTQAGATPAVYRHPDNIYSARVFSDPPLNEIGCDKRGDRLVFADGRMLDAVGPFINLADGAYTIGFRAETATLWELPGATFSFPARTTVTEISGSESFVHVDTGTSNWVCLLPGIHPRRPGEDVDVHIDAAKVFIFDAAGALAVAPEPAPTA